MADTRKIKRIVDGKELHGTVTVSNGNYKYDYPFMREIRKKLISGDRIRIARTLIFKVTYIDYVLNGTRFNADVYRAAVAQMKENIAKGWVDEVEEKEIAGE